MKSKMKIRFHILILICFGIVLSNCGLDLNIYDDPDETPPIVSITSPNSGDIVTGYVRIYATADDNREVDRVQFYVNEEVLGFDSASPYSRGWGSNNYANGRYDLSAIAKDNAGNETVSEIVTVVLDNPFKVYVTNNLEIPVVAVANNSDAKMLNASQTMSFELPTNPGTLQFHAESFSLSEDSLLIGSTLNWDIVENVITKARFEINLNADSSWVFIYVSNQTSYGIGPFYVNYGTALQSKDNIFFAPRTFLNMTGYYEARSGMVVRVGWENGPGFSYWVEGRDFDLDWTENQVVTVRK
ncbi:Ig-like domain-containing protein [bacterium]|nr:Ig-like domain-containing protein [bacterium]